MPGVLSRLLLGGGGEGAPVDVRVPCHVLSHPWSQSCIRANWELLQKLVVKCLQIYFALYSASGVIRLKGLNYWRWPFLRDTLRSALMLITNGFLLFSLNCASRNAFGKANPLILKSVILIASFAAIMVERPYRRKLLSLYMGSNAVECMYNRLVETKDIRHHRNLDVTLFVSGASVLGYYLKENAPSIEEIKSSLRFIIGACEEQSAGVGREEEDFMAKLEKKCCSKGFLAQRDQFFAQIGAGKAASCLHDHPCLQYISQGLVRGFTSGFILSFAISLVRNLSKLSNPRLFIRRLMSSSNLKAAVFLSLFVSIFRGASCSLRALFQENSPAIGAVAGGLAGLSILFWRSYIVSLYVAAKALEVLFTETTKDTWIAKVPFKTELVYALGVVETIFGVVVHPHNVRPEYREFIQGAAGWKFSAFNRQIAAAHWNYPVKNVPRYPDFDPIKHQIYQFWAHQQRLKLLK